MQRHTLVAGALLAGIVITGGGVRMFTCRHQDCFDLSLEHQTAAPWPDNFGTATSTAAPVIISSATTLGTLIL